MDQISPNLKISQRRGERKTQKKTNPQLCYKSTVGCPLRWRVRDNRFTSYTTVHSKEPVLQVIFNTLSSSLYSIPSARPLLKMCSTFICPAEPIIWVEMMYPFSFPSSSVAVHPKALTTFVCSRSLFASFGSTAISSVTRPSHGPLSSTRVSVYFPASEARSPLMVNRESANVFCRNEQEKENFVP